VHIVFMQVGTPLPYATNDTYPQSDGSS